MPSDGFTTVAFLSVSPLGKGESVSAYVARCLDVIEASGVTHELGPMGTTLEGSWEEVMEVARRCVAELEDDCDRVSVLLKIDHRREGPGRLARKMESVRGARDRDGP